MPEPAHTLERLSIALTPDAIARLAYSAGRKRGEYETLRARVMQSRRKPSVATERRMVMLRTDAIAIEQHIGLSVEWPREASWASSPRSRLTSAGDTHGTE